MLKSVTVMALGFCLCVGQIVSKCPVIETIKDFDLPKFMGVWYEQERYFNVFQMGASCVTMEYEMNGNLSISINNTELNELTGKHSTLFGLAHYTGDKDVSQFTVEYPFLGSIEGDYYILDSDYTTYAVVWACSEVLIANFEYAWILTRDRFPTEDLLMQIKDKIVKRGLSVSKFERTDQTRCHNE